MESRTENGPPGAGSPRGRHLDRLELKRLASGELTQTESIEISRHLIDCADCRRAVKALRTDAADRFESLLRELEGRAWLAATMGDDPPEAEIPPSWPPNPEPSPPTDEPDLADRPTMAPVRRPDRSASLLLTELEELEIEERLRTVHRDPAYHRRELAELLLAASWEARVDDAFVAEERAREALAVLENLGSDFDHLEALEDLRTRAWAYLGNSLRMRHRLGEAEKAFRRADHHLARGSKDPQLRAEVLLLQGGLLREQHRFEEAYRIFDQVIAIQRWAGDRERQCECLITKANTYNLQGDLDRAISALEQAAELLEPTFDPLLAMCVQENRAVYLVQGGRPEEAAELLPEVREFFERAGMRQSRLRLRWLEGQLAARLGRGEEAERLLRRVTGDFLEADFPYESALASLELAGLLLEQGRTAEAQELARDMIQVFDALDIQREAFTALLMFQKAMLEETATVGMARDLARQLGRIQTNPALRHEKPS